VTWKPGTQAARIWYPPADGADGADEAATERPLGAVQPRLGREEVADKADGDD
jgi:hypothetical protein